METKSFKLNRVKYLIPFSVLISIAHIWGDKVVYGSELSVSTGIMLKFLGIAIVWYAVLTLLYNFLVREKSELKRNRYTEHIFRNTFLVLAFAWLPHLIIKYPVGMCYDTYKQLRQGLGQMPLTTQHSVFHTLLFTAFVKAGLAAGSANIGAFLFCLFEYLIMCSVFSYTISVLHRSGASEIVIIVGTVFFSVSPFITGFIEQSIKDVLFSVFVVLFLTIIADWCCNREIFWNNKNILKLIAASILVVLTRNNGIFCIAPALIAVILYETHMDIYQNKAKAKILIALSICLVMPVTLQKGINMVSGAEKDSAAVLFSLPFQQTARYVSLHRGQMMTTEETETINKVLPVNDLPWIYEESASDNVMNRMEETATSEDFANYLTVWIKMFFRDPLCYLSATMRQNIYLIYPGWNNHMYYCDCNVGNFKYDNGIEFSTPKKLQEFKDKYYVQYLELLHETPGLEFLNNMAVYVIFAIAFFFFIITKKDYILLVIFVPMYMLLLTIIAGPTVVWHPRYTFPIIWSFPVWAGICEARWHKKVIE